MNARDICEDLAKRPDTRDHEIEVCMPYDVARRIQPGADVETVAKIVGSFVRLSKELVEHEVKEVAVIEPSEEMGIFGVAGDAEALCSVVHLLEGAAKKHFGPQAQIEFEDVHDSGYLGMPPGFPGPSP